MTFSRQIVLFTVACVLVALLLTISGGVITFRQLAINQQKHQFESVVSLIDNQLGVQPETPEFAQWLPSWLRAHNIQVLDVSNRGGSIYTFRELKFTGNTEQLTHYQYPLLQHPEFMVQVWVESPLKRLSYEPSAIIAMLGGLVVIIGGLLGVFYWSKRLLRGAELLEARGNRILLGRLERGRSKEWPGAASKALDQMISDLKEARQERSRFDRMIRQNAFIDELTKLSNRTHFLNQLEAEIGDADAHTGAVLVVYLKGMDDINYQYARSEGDALLKQCAELLQKATARNGEISLSRYSGDEFALLLPLSTQNDAEDLAHVILRDFERITLPPLCEAEDFFYIGIAGYQYGDNAQLVVEQAEDAVRVAQMQGSNGWYVEERELNSELTGKGSVRWRTTLQYALEHKQLHYQAQPVFDQDGQIHHRELLIRIRNMQGAEINAGVFMPWAKRSGLVEAFDIETLKFALTAAAKHKQILAINLGVELVLQTPVMKMLVQWLFSAPAKQVARLVIEFRENELAALDDAQMLRLKALNRKGLQLAVDKAGQQVLSTQYLSELSLVYLKLHPSLVRDIHLRHVNRLAVGSLMASCAERTEVIATGVERNEEWRVLQRLGIKSAQGHWFGRPEAFTEA
ncbi:EAL domain-containing protein [Aliagarivorans taiwanensis]|uniref:EAL domain-containing protein n=1 Tax=Aliagarivorans taiwanensis TaxID=561966 RepID=UPI000400EC84|nr:EAL domain-containing protein [Aliagarivorans taiwanensis]